MMMLREAVEKRIAGPKNKAKTARRGVAALWASARAGHVTGRKREHVRWYTRRMSGLDEIDPRNPIAFAVGLGSGAVACYFLDPSQGRRRRHQARDRALSIAREGTRGAGRRVVRTARLVRGRAIGAAHRDGHGTELDDASLADKVRSEALRDHEVPKGQVNVNVEHGTVVLRGQLTSQEQIDHLIKETEHVDGVRSVKSLLHTP
jgi:hypothetical protein